MVKTAPRWQRPRLPASPVDPGFPADPPRRARYRAIWISDLHLGTRGCKSDQLLDFLRHHDCDNLYLVGDVIDGWSLRRSWYWNETQNRVVREILDKSAHGTVVSYICGNHDEFLRSYLGLVLGDIVVKDEDVHVTADGRCLLIQHGDQFDLTMGKACFLAYMGDRLYQVALAFNSVFNWVRRKLGRPYWSVSAYLKGKVKDAVAYVGKYESMVADAARQRGFDGIVCGHIHKAEIREIDGILYCNDGDWVESCTALVETWSGELKIICWRDPAEHPADRRERLRRSAATASG